jgi:predicted  nucleic acid-binding Zn-ribbon protein
MTVAQISELLHDHLQNGQLELTENTIAQVPLGGVLNLLQSSGLMFQNAVIATPEEGVSLTGSVALLGAESVELEALFQDAESSVRLNLSAKNLPAIEIPGASWLKIQNAQLVVQVSGTQEITGTISGTVSLDGHDIQTVLMIGKVKDELLLQWTIADLDINSIASVFLEGASLPPELPNLVFDVDAIVNPKSRTFSFAASTQEPINFPADGNGLSITETHFAVSRQVIEDGTSQIQSSIAIKGATPLQISDDLSLERVELNFALEGKSWSISGEVAANVLESVLTLKASYEQSEATKKFTLETVANPAIIVAKFNTGHLDFSGLTLEFEKESTGESAWSVAGTGAIAVEEVLDAGGTITLSKTTDGTTSFVLTPDPEHASAHILLPPDQTSSMDLGFGEIAIVRRTTPTGSAISFNAEVDLAFKGFNPKVQNLLPTVTKATFKADANGVMVTVDRLLAPVDFVLPDIDINDTTIRLGTASIDVSDLSVRLGKKIELAAELGIGLPANLNNLFGVNADGTAKIEFFNTFDPNDRDNTVVKTRLSIGTEGIKLVPTSSIIRAIEIKEETDENGNVASFWYCTLGKDGEFGQVKFKVPEFSYDAKTTSFRASGGFETIKPLALPLTPAKLLLSACKLQGAADALPDSLLLKEVKIVDDQGNLRVEELLAAMGSVGANLPQDVKDGLQVIGDRVDLLPDDFKQYLNIEIPQSFDFEIAVTPEGTVRFDARVKDGDPPIKLITAGLLGVLPVLNCISLRGISFGELAGGSLFLLQVDATIDQFDLVTLATSLALPDIANNPLPSTRTLHRRLILDHLFMMIVYQTVIPIPIPLFYDEIGIEYLGLEGLQFGAHAQFPMPSLNLAEVGALLSDFKQFFSDRDFLLDPQKPIRDTNLILSLKKNFLSLPKYLGGQTLGDANNGPEINAYENLANLLNGMKTLSVNELIQAMPLDRRVGSTQVAFGPMSASLGWMVTTPGEFRQITAQPEARQLTYSRLGLTTDVQAASMVSVLPPVSSAQAEQGMVVFLRGSADLNNLARFETVFGLAASDAIGFKTGFKMSGNISDVMDLNLSGLVQISGKASPAFRLAGQSLLRFRNQTMFQGDVQITDDRFQCQGSLNLFGVGGAVSMLIDQKSGAEIRGAINPIDLTVFKLNQASVFLKIQPNQVPILNLRSLVELLGITNQTDVTISEQGFNFTTSGNLFNAFGGTIQASGTQINSTANFRVKATLGAISNPPINDPNAQQRSVLQQQAAQLKSQISAAQAQLNQLRSSPFARTQIPALTSAINALNQQLTLVNARLAALPPAPIAAANPRDFTQALKHEVTQALNQAITQSNTDLSAAQAGVTKAKKDLDDWDIKIANQRQAVREARQRAVNAADAGVNAAQRKVDDINGQITQKQKDLSGKQSELANATPKQVCVNVPIIGRQCTPAIFTDAIKEILKGLNKAIDGLNSAIGELNNALRQANSEVATANNKLAEAKRVFASSVDSDPSVIALVGTRIGLQKTFDLANQGLEGLKKVPGTVIQAANFVAQRSLDALLIVQSASFDTDINTAATGQVMLSVQLSYMDKPTTFAASFNFNDSNALKAMGQAIAQKLLNP